MKEVNFCSYFFFCVEENKIKLGLTRPRSATASRAIVLSASVIRTRAASASASVSVSATTIIIIRSSFTHILTRSRCVGTVCDRIINTDLSFVNIHTIQCIASTRGISLILKVYKAKASRSVGLFKKLEVLLLSIKELLLFTL
jgi:hypothetical protein